MNEHDSIRTRKIVPFIGKYILCCVHRENTTFVQREWHVSNEISFLHDSIDRRCSRRGEKRKRFSFLTSHILSANVQNMIYVYLSHFYFYAPHLIFSNTLLTEIGDIRRELKIPRRRHRNFGTKTTTIQVQVSIL